jgi:hypothetical protein
MFFQSPTDAGWWYTYPSEQYDFVRLEKIIPTIGENKSHVPNHQPDGYLTNQEGVWQSQLPAKTQLVQADASVLWHLF